MLVSSVQAVDYNLFMPCPLCNWDDHTHWPPFTYNVEEYIDTLLVYSPELLDGFQLNLVRRRLGPKPFKYVHIKCSNSLGLWDGRFNLVTIGPMGLLFDSIRGRVDAELNTGCPFTQTDDVTGELAMFDSYPRSNCTSESAES